MNYLIAQGGGPTAVINSSLEGVVETVRSLDKTAKIYGARFGAEGILKKDLIDLTNVPASEIALLKNTPASAIGSCRRKLGDDDYPAVIDCLKTFNIGAFFYNGGNDSMDTCNKVNILSGKEGLDVKVMGIPKTIDNDLYGTDHSPGFGSAARFAALNTAELSLDASALPIHVVVLELMGRNAGWITASSAFARKLTKCEILTYLPEKKVDMSLLLSDVEKAWAKKKGVVVAVSEGLCGVDGLPLADTGLVDGFGHKIPGGVASYISSRIISDLKIKSRAEKPGLIGRTSMGYISPVDREEAYGVGKKAVEEVLKGRSGYMVAISAERDPIYKARFELVELEKVANVEKTFPEEWITGTTVSEEFFRYCEPLLGGELPLYADLR